MIPVSGGGPTNHSAIGVPEFITADPTSNATSSHELKEIDFAELKDGTLVELIEIQQIHAEHT